LGKTITITIKIQDHWSLFFSIQRLALIVQPWC